MSIKCGAFLDFPRKYQLFKEGCAVLCGSYLIVHSVIRGNLPVMSGR